MPVPANLFREFDHAARPDAAPERPCTRGGLFMARPPPLESHREPVKATVPDGQGLVASEPVQDQVVLESSGKSVHSAVTLDYAKLAGYGATAKQAADELEQQQKAMQLAQAELASQEAALKKANEELERQKAAVERATEIARQWTELAKKNNIRSSPVTVLPTQALECAEADEIARQQEALERANAEDLARQQAAVENQKAEELARQQEALERAKAGELARQQAAVENQKAEELARQQEALERTQKEELARQQAAVENQKAEELARQQDALERAQKEELARQQAAVENQKAEELARQQEALERAKAEELARQQAAVENQKAEELARQQEALERAKAEELARQQVASQTAEELDRQLEELERTKAELAKAQEIAFQETQLASPQASGAKDARALAVPETGTLSLRPGTAANLHSFLFIAKHGVPAGAIPKARGPMAWIELTGGLSVARICLPSCAHIDACFLVLSMLPLPRLYRYVQGKSSKEVLDAWKDPAERICPSHL